jgi:hypothetical protein
MLWRHSNNGGRLSLLGGAVFAWPAIHFAFQYAVTFVQLAEWHAKVDKSWTARAIFLLRYGKTWPYLSLWVVGSFLVGWIFVREGAASWKRVVDRLTKYRQSKKSNDATRNDYRQVS